MENPKNQHQLALWYLYNYEFISLKTVINDSMFFKFQTRLSELESRFGSLAKREKVKFENRFGRISDYNVYSAIDKNKIKEIYDNL